MNRCAKCNTPMPPEARICRTCGGIVAKSPALEEVGKEPIEPTLAEVAPPPNSHLPPRSAELPWRCPNCGEQIEASFDICWSCGTASDGTKDPSFLSERETTGIGSNAAEIESEPLRSAPPNVTAPHCHYCLSRHIIVNARVTVEPNGSGIVIGHVASPPEAGQLLADVCSSCGRVELHVANVQALIGSRTNLS